MRSWLHSKEYGVSIVRLFGKITDVHIYIGKNRQVWLTRMYDSWGIHIDIGRWYISIPFKGRVCHWMPKGARVYDSRKKKESFYRRFRKVSAKPDRRK